MKQEDDVPVFKLFRASSSLIKRKFATLADSLAVLVRLPNLRFLSTLDHSPSDTSNGAALISDMYIYIYIFFILATDKKVEKESRQPAL